MKAKLTPPAVQQKDLSACRAKLNWKAEDECSRKQVDQDSPKLVPSPVIREVTPKPEEVLKLDGLDGADSYTPDWLYSVAAYTPTLTASMNHTWPVDDDAVAKHTPAEPQDIDWLYDFSAYKPAYKAGQKA